MSRTRCERCEPAEGGWLAPYISVWYIWADILWAYSVHGHPAGALEVYMMGAGTCWLTILALAGGGDPPTPSVVITPILHQGDPAPGIPNATVVYMLPPQIDGQGNVLIDGFYQIEGEPFARNGLWYGGSGSLQAVSFEGMQAPDLPAGVVIDFTGDTWLGENGWVGFTGFLSGPGIIPGYNDLANFAGPPGEIHKVLQGGDPAPGLALGTIIDASSGTGLSPWLSDNGSLLVIAYLAGPGVNASNDRAIWLGPPDQLELVYRRGMHAPGTDPSVTFAWALSVVFNDSRIAFRGQVTGPGVTDQNSTGYWTGGAGGLELIAREGDPAPGIEGDVVFLGTGGPRLNAVNDLAFPAGLTGEGINDDNNVGRWVAHDGVVTLIAREGSPIPDSMGEITFGPGTNPIVAEPQKAAFASRLNGAVDPTNDVAVFLGGYEGPTMVLRASDPVVGEVPGTVYADLIFGVEGMNDSADAIGLAKINGPDVDETSNRVLILRDHRTVIWYPLARTGDEIAGRIWVADELGGASSMFWTDSGGSDGRRQSFNDARRLAAKLEFTDGSHGVYLVHPPVLGDSDADGDSDLLDYAQFLACVGVPGGGDLSDECQTFDIDWDADVDFADFGFLQTLIGSDE